jgi:ectoine hydroxylase-related dioxygenase (phytanoyl-CoA dioxygenase family)
MMDTSTAEVASTMNIGSANRAASGKKVDRLDVNLAVDAIRRVLSRLTFLTGWFCIEFGDGSQWFVNGAEGIIADAHPAMLSIAVIRISPAELVQIIEGKLDATARFVFGKFEIGGSVRAALLFCTALAGKHTMLPNEDAGELPKPTRSIRKAKQDLAEFGYCLVQEALPAAETKRLRDRLVEQAAGEAEAGVAHFEGSPGVGGLEGLRQKPNQRVYNLINKGGVFEELLMNPLIDEFVLDSLGESAIISSYIANIAGPNGNHQHLHIDQIMIQPPIPHIMAGLNFMWFLDDVTERNGGTRIMPRSFNPGVAPLDPCTTEGTVPAEGPAGTALIFDSRLWHGTGANRTSAPRHVILLYVTRCFLRQQENFALSLRPEVENRLPDRVKVLLGFRCTDAMGGVEGPTEGQMVSRLVSPVGILSPKA